MTGAVVRKLKARAVIARPAPEIRRARRLAMRGDRAWQLRLERYEHGDVVIVELTALAVIESDTERPQTVPCCHETVWIDHHSEREVAEQRLREIVRRDFKTVGNTLRDHHGIQLNDDEDAVSVDIDIQAALAQHLPARVSPPEALRRGPGITGSARSAPLAQP